VLHLHFRALHRRGLREEEEPWNMVRLRYLNIDLEKELAELVEYGTDLAMLTHEVDGKRT